MARMAALEEAEEPALAVEDPELAAEPLAEVAVDAADDRATDAAAATS